MSQEEISGRASVSSVDAGASPGGNAGPRAETDSFEAEMLACYQTVEEVMDEVTKARPELSKEAVMAAVAEARSLGRLVSRAKLLELGLEEKEVMIVLRIEAAKLRAAREEQQQQQRRQMEEQQQQQRTQTEEQIREEMGTWAEEMEMETEVLEEVATLVEEVRTGRDKATKEAVEQAVAEAAEEPMDTNEGKRKKER